MAVQATASLCGIWSNTLHASPRRPHLEYMSARLLATKSSASKPSATATQCSCAPRRGAASAAAAPAALESANSVGATPARRMAAKASSASRCKEFRARHETSAVQETRLGRGTARKTRAAEPASAHREYVVMRWLARKVDAAAAPESTRRAWRARARRRSPARPHDWRCAARGREAASSGGRERWPRSFPMRRFHAQLK
ncbi:hypothetical protein EJB05_21883, partial [Eragrostis curvula]